MPKFRERALQACGIRRLDRVSGAEAAHDLKARAFSAHNTQDWAPACQILKHLAGNRPAWGWEMRDEYIRRSHLGERGLVADIAELGHADVPGHLREILHPGVPHYS